MKIRIVKSVNKNDFIELYKDAGWWRSGYDDDTSFIDNLVANSLFFAGAFDDDGKMVGMGRVISDGCSDAYIQDVVVLSSHRNQGIGGNIIMRLVSEATKNGIDWIGLIGEPGTEQFYSKLGFETLKGYVPMKWRNP